MFNGLSSSVKRKLRSFDESGMGYWRIRAFLRDGRTYSNVYINDRFHLGFPDVTPFTVKDIVDVEWEGYRGASSDSVPFEITTKT